MPRLTAAAIAKLRPEPERRIIPDGGGLFLVIQPSGHKSWMMRFRGQGKLVLGPVDLSAGEHEGEPVIGAPLTLAGARQLAAQKQRERAQGRNPVADHKAIKLQRHTARAKTAEGSYGAWVRRFAEEYAKPRNRTWRDALKQLGLAYPRDGGEPLETKGGLAQRWADRAVTEITDHDIDSVLDEARRSGTPGLGVHKRKISDHRARDLHTALSSFFGWLHKRRPRIVSSNPAAGVLRPSNAMARERVLTSDEIVRLWRACDKINGQFGAVLKLLLLTGQRLNEIAAMRWDELREDSLHLPGARTKNKKPHIVPLSPLALQIIAAVPRIEHCPFVFSTTGRSPISGWSKLKGQLDEAMNNPQPWRIHDLRRSAVTGMAELGIRPDVIELCVNHIGGHRAGIAGVYNRSQLLSERRDALLRWSQHVQGLVSGKPVNVIKLRRK